MPREANKNSPHKHDNEKKLACSPPGEEEDENKTRLRKSTLESLVSYKPKKPSQSDMERSERSKSIGRKCAEKVYKGKKGKNVEKSYISVNPTSTAVRTEKKVQEMRKKTEGEESNKKKLVKGTSLPKEKGIKAGVKEEEKPIAVSGYKKNKIFKSKCKKLDKSAESSPKNKGKTVYDEITDDDGELKKNKIIPDKGAVQVQQNKKVAKPGPKSKKNKKDVAQVKGNAKDIAQTKTDAKVKIAKDNAKDISKGKDTAVDLGRSKKRTKGDSSSDDNLPLAKIPKRNGYFDDDDDDDDEGKGKEKEKEKEKYKEKKVVKKVKNEKKRKKKKQSENSSSEGKMGKEEVVARPKRMPRMASLNAAAKVQCLYGKEGDYIMDHSSTSDSEVSHKRNIILMKSNNKKALPCATKKVKVAKLKPKVEIVEIQESQEDEILERETRLRNTPGVRSAGKNWDVDTPSSSEDEVKTQIIPEGNAQTPILPVQTDPWGFVKQEPLDMPPAESMQLHQQLIPQDLTTKQQMPVKGHPPLRKKRKRLPRNKSDAAKSGDSSGEDHRQILIEQRMERLKRRKRVKKEVPLGLKDIMATKRMTSLNASARIEASCSSSNMCNKSPLKSEEPDQITALNLKTVNVSTLDLKVESKSGTIPSSDLETDSKRDTTSSSGADVSSEVGAGPEIEMEELSRKRRTAQFTTYYKMKSRQSICNISEISGGYRISATSHTQTEATVATETVIHPPHHNAGGNAGRCAASSDSKAYAPLNALSSMQPPGNAQGIPIIPPPVIPQSIPNKEHHHAFSTSTSSSTFNSSSLFGRPQLAGALSAPPGPILDDTDASNISKALKRYYQPAGPLISHQHHHHHYHHHHLGSNTGPGSECSDSEASVQPTAIPSVVPVTASPSNANTSTPVHGISKRKAPEEFHHPSAAQPVTTVAPSAPPTAPESQYTYPYYPSPVQPFSETFYGADPFLHLNYMHKGSRIPRPPSMYPLGSYPPSSHQTNSGREQFFARAHHSFSTTEVFHQSGPGDPTRNLYYPSDQGYYPHVAASAPPRYNLDASHSSNLSAVPKNVQAGRLTGDISRGPANSNGGNMSPVSGISISLEGTQQQQQQNLPSPAQGSGADVAVSAAKTGNVEEPTAVRVSVLNLLVIDRREEEWMEFDVNTASNGELFEFIMARIRAKLEQDPNVVENQKYYNADILLLSRELDRKSGEYDPFAEHQRYKDARKATQVTSAFGEEVGKCCLFKRKRTRRNKPPAKGKKNKLLDVTVALPSQEDITLGEELLRKHREPKDLHFSNGWSWVGEPYVAKIFLDNTGAQVSRVCFPSMKHVQGDVLFPGDAVLLKAGSNDGLPFVAQIAYMWENAEDGEMMMSISWYYRPEHTGHKNLMPESPHELYASRHKDVTSVACVEDKCYVLSYGEYCRFRKLFKYVSDPISVDEYWLVPPRPYSCSYYTFPPLDTPLDSVFFCKRVFDFRQKRLLHNLTYEQFESDTWHSINQ